MKTYKIQKYKCMMVRDGRMDSPLSIIDSAGQAAMFFMKSLEGLPHEEMHVVFLSGNNRIIGFESVARGSSTSMILTASDVLRSAIAVNARAFIIAHNHPSGNPEPSKDDIDFSKQLFRAGCLLGIRMLDSLVCCPEARKWRDIEFDEDSHEQK